MQTKKKKKTWVLSLKFMYLDNNDLDFGFQFGSSDEVIVSSKQSCGQAYGCNPSYPPPISQIHLVIYHEKLGAYVKIIE